MNAAPRRSSAPFFRRRWLLSLLAAGVAAGCQPEGVGTVKLPPPAPVASAPPAKVTVTKQGRRFVVQQGPDGRKG